MDLNCVCMFLVIVYSYLAMFSAKEDTKQTKRDCFDPQCEDMKTYKELSKFNMAKLAEITSGSAGILRYCCTDTESPMDVVKEEEVVATPVILSPYDVFRDGITLSEFCSEMSVNASSKLALAEVTKEQSLSAGWMHHRKGRITASQMYMILTHVNNCDEICGAMKTVVGAVMGYTPSFTSAACQHGITNESRIRYLYSSNQSKCHSESKVDLTGLWISSSHPYIAASPDGFVSCSCCGDGLLEIKCPWTKRHMTADEYLASDQDVLHVSDGKVTMNDKHKYYAQVQTQMECTGRHYCDFVTALCSETDTIMVHRVYRDDEFINMMYHKAEIFYKEVILQEFSSKAVEKLFQNK